MHKKVEGKIQIGKVSKTKIQISHIHTAPKSTSESQGQITHLLPAPEPARGYKPSKSYKQIRNIMFTANVQYYTQQKFRVGQSGGRPPGPPLELPLGGLRLCC